MAEAKIEITLSNGAKAGETLKELSKQANTLNKEIKDLKPGSQEFIDKSKDLQQVSGKMADIRNQIKGTNVASNELKNSFAGILSQIPGFSMITGAMGQATTGVGGLTRGFGILKGAIISTGIGALVVLLGSLFAWFQKTERGSDLLAKGMAAAGAAVNVLIDRASKLIDALIAFANGNWTEAANLFADATTGITEEILKETAAAWKLADALDALEDRQNDFILTLAKARKELSELQRIYDDETMSIEQRTAAIAKAQEIQRKTSAEKMDMIREELRITLQLEELNDEMLNNFIENGIKLEEVGMSESLEADRKAAIEILARFVDAQGEISGNEIELIRKLNKIKKKERGEDTRDATANAKAQEQAKKDQLAAEQNIEDLRIALKDESFEKENAKLNLQAQRQIANLKGTKEQIAEQERLINKKLDADRQALLDKFAEDEVAREEAKQKRKLQLRMEAHELDLATDQNLLNEQLLNTELTRDQWQLQTEQKALEFQKRKLDLIREGLGEESMEYQQAFQQYLAMQQATSDQAVAIKQKEMDDQRMALNATLQVAGDFFGTLASFQQQGTEQWKAFATAQAIMSAIQSATNAYQSTAAIPIVGPGLAPIAAGLALAAGMQNVRRIRATKAEAPTAPVRAARGYVANGPSHDQGGINVEIEGDEIVMTKGVFRNPYLRRMASALNVAAGGISFDSTPPSNPFRTFAAGGVGMSAAGSSGDALTVTAMRNIMEEMRAMQQDQINRIRVVNVVTDTEEGIRTVNQIRDDADV